MNKKRLFSITLVLILLFSTIPTTKKVHANSDTPYPRTTPEISLLPEKSLKNAKVIKDINDRHVLVPPGRKQLYRIQGTEIYVEVTAEELRSTTKRLTALTGSTTYTQVCGLNIIYGGMLWAELRNRANVTYFTGYTLAPARINWMDMRGTRSTIVFAKWKGLGQYSYPSLRQRFERYGYTQAYGNLEMCFYPFGCLTNYFTSRLVISSSRTYCQ